MRSARNNRFSLDDVPEDVVANLPDFNDWPSRLQHDQWWKYLRQPVALHEGNWFEADCPRHKPYAAGEVGTALINFRAGCMKCNCTKYNGYTTLNNLADTLGIVTTIPSRVEPPTSKIDWDAMEPDPADVAIAAAKRAEREAIMSRLDNVRKARSR